MYRISDTGHRILVGPFSTVDSYIGFGAPFGPRIDSCGQRLDIVAAIPNNFGGDPVRVRPPFREREGM